MALKISRAVLISSLQVLDFSLQAESFTKEVLHRERVENVADFTLGAFGGETTTSVCPYEKGYRIGS